MTATIMRRDRRSGPFALIGIRRRFDPASFAFSARETLPFPTHNADLQDGFLRSRQCARAFIFGWKTHTMDVMRLRRSTDFEPLREAWQDLAAGNPMQGWHWQSTWWKHYGRSRPGAVRELFTLVVSDGPKVLAIAPWLLEHSAARGRVVRFLGEDEVCTDYPALLCRGEARSRAAAAVADYLMNEFTSWDVLDLSGVSIDDATIAELITHLGEVGCCRFSRQEVYRCWRFALPSSWDAYMQTLAKTVRRRLRKLKKSVLDAQRLTTHRVTDDAELDAAWKVLVDLHQRRRQSLGQPGCFASERFAAFHGEVARQLLENGQLRLAWFELDGRPVSAEYNFASPNTIYAYQGGVEPESLHEQPGHLSSMQMIRWAIESGHRNYDFLRGDEHYKSQWGAQPTGMYAVRIVRERATSQIREAAYQAAGNFREWLSAGWRMVRETTPGAYAS